MKKIAGLDKCRIIEAIFIWTEPHSDRIKVAVDVEKSVLDEKMLVRQKVVVEFTIKHKQCMECIREATDHSWGSLIQLRQRVGHKKSFYQLESLLVSKGLHNLMMNVTVTREGMDMYFKSNNQADRVMQCISSHMPTRAKASKKLVSLDRNNNVGKYEVIFY